MDDRPALLAQLTLLKDSWPGQLPWTWDGRFAAIASSFGADVDAAAKASARHAFPRGWTANSIDTAPPELIALTARTGGLRAGQRLLAGDDASRGLFGLWWPWGNGDKVTLRIGILGVDAIPEIRTLFGVK